MQHRAELKAADQVNYTRGMNEAPFRLDPSATHDHFYFHPCLLLAPTWTELSAPLTALLPVSPFHRGLPDLPPPPQGTKCTAGLYGFEPSKLLTVFVSDITSQGQ